MNIHSQRADSASAKPRLLPRPDQAPSPWNSIDDTGLMVEVGRGGVEAFATLVDRHSTTLYRVARRMLSDAHEAEDVVQECFARLWQNAPRWKPSGAGLVGWLHRVTMNLCFDRQRRMHSIVTPIVPDRADEAPLADHQLQMDQTQRAIAGALGDLPERHRAALVLCYYEGFTNALAADVLDLNIKAMESLLFRARRQLRELLQARDISCRDLEQPA
ncbi:MAG TPA: RNA polymerase sigma factor [Sphingobium sp.]|uniref:RNA polymerase sigma factor n=1 Tax=Sphingobium sp. TaxID=1912891 RepID=UPI002ED1C698